MSKRFWIETFGCQMNLNDSEVIGGILLDAGYRPADALNQADLVIINTCAIRQKAVDKAYGMIGRAFHEKKLRPSVIIGVAGCVVEIEKEEMLRRKGVDFALGTRSLYDLPELITQAEMGRRVISIEDTLPECQARTTRHRQSPYHGWVTIIHGCNRFCTYCIVPYARGREKSRPMADILQEVTHLAQSGVKEITFLGQNVDAYGTDFKDASTCFADLLRHSAAISGIDRIWFMTSYPSDFTQELIHTIANEPKIARSIHLPVQSGSDEILKKMNRRYLRRQYMDLIEAIRKEIPDASISSDVIVGFPTESEKDFEQTVSLVKEARFERLNLAMYSPRPGTVAAKVFQDEVPQKTKNERLQTLLMLQKAINAEIHRAFQDTRVEVIVEAPTKPSSHMCYGRTSHNKIVIFPCSKSDIGKWVSVQIHRTTAGPLYGEVVESVTA